MHNSSNQIYFTVFCLLYMFRTNLLVHHQEHGMTCCITQCGTVVQATLAALKLWSYLQLQSSQSCLHDCTKLCNTVYYAVLLMMDDWIRSKHVEQTKNCEIIIDYKNCASRQQPDSHARLYRLYQLCNTVYYAVLLMMNDQIRSKRCRADKKLWNKTDYKNCASR